MDAHDTPIPRPIVGRFAPTPSGRMHLGNAFSCLMAWLAVRSVGGRMVLRIEDLDPRARNQHLAGLLMDDLRWLGLDWDVGPLYQSQRSDRYVAAIRRLGEQGLTYPCFCTRAELHAASAPHASDGTYVYQQTCRYLTAQEVARRTRERPPAIRVAVPNEGDPSGDILVKDCVYGSWHEVLARDCGDFLVQRSDGVVAYQLAVVVDDAEMGITQVVRGRDLLGSAARQTWLARQLGFAPPNFAHVPLLVAPDGRRLSKRERDLDLGMLRERHRRPEAVVSWLARRVGLSHGDEQVSAADLVGRFSWDAIREHRADIVVGEGLLGALTVVENRDCEV